MKGKQPMENNRWVASRRFKLYTARTQKEKAITQPRLLSLGNSKLDFMVSQTTKSDHPHRSFGSKASKEDDEPTLEVLGVA